MVPASRRSQPFPCDNRKTSLTRPGNSSQTEPLRMDERTALQERTVVNEGHLVCPCSLLP